MTYSSAIFTQPEMSLEQAQREKYRRLLDSLEARPGDHILEIGCGWGGFAEEAARRGHKVTGITLSREQLVYARKRIEKAGLAHLVEFEYRDYRDLQENFDHIVSIEMFEAVGERYWQGYFETIRKCLKPGGHAALQIITIDETAFETYRNKADFIQKYIFPGGMLPAVEHLASLAATASLRLDALSRHGRDYASTLRAWHRSFDERSQQVDALGFDERFRRMWKYYLSYCEAGFLLGRIDLVQLRLTNSQA
jgi:cyclopropane-fatty-acyl-phospholipid synthase